MISEGIAACATHEAKPVCLALVPTVCPDCSFPRAETLTVAC